MADREEALRGMENDEAVNAADIDLTDDSQVAEEAAAEGERLRRRAAVRKKGGSKQEKTKKQDRKKKNRKAPKIILCVILILALLTGVVALTALYDSNRLEKTFYQVKSNKVTDNVRIVCLADLHLKEFGENNSRLIHEVEKLSPDIIALVGDMNVEQEPDNYQTVIDLCVKLNEIAPVYYSLGNHEIDAMLFHGSNIYKDVKKAGIKILNNETDTITIGGTQIDVIGLTQNPVEFEEYGKEFFDKAMSESDNFKLVLNHYPEQFFGTLDDYEIDLALAGHAHGGQVRLPWIGGLYAADQGFFPKLCDGYHEVGNSRVIITRGLGKSSWFPRIFNKPEIAVVDIGWY